MKDFPERTGLYVLPPPDEINEGRKNYKVYWWFCLHFIEAVVGSAKWKQCKASQQLRKFVTPSDEAFAMVVYENNFARWYEEYFEVDPRQREQKPNGQIAGMQERVAIRIRDSAVGQEKAWNK